MTANRLNSGSWLARSPVVAGAWRSRGHEAVPADYRNKVIDRGRITAS